MHLDDGSSRAVEDDSESKDLQVLRLLQQHLAVSDSWSLLAEECKACKYSEHPYR